MKTHRLWPLLTVALLAACGGGGGGVPPIPVTRPTSAPTNAPTTAPQTYSLKLSITGGAEPRSGVSYERRSESSTIQSSSTPPPVLMVAPDTTSGLGAYSVGTADGSALATVTVNPAPSASPAATWAGPSSVSVTPQSDPTKAAIATTQVNQTGSGTLTVNVTVNGAAQSPIQSPIFTYPRVTVSCPQVDQSGGPIPQEWVQGVVFDANGNPSATNDPTQADLYVTGPKCYGAYGSSESATTVHFPHGGHMYSDTFKSFNEYTAADYQSDETSITVDAMQAASPMLTTVTFKDALGTIHFVHFDTLGDLDRESGAHKACGHNPVDGSC